MQIVVLGFDDLKFEDQILGELRRLRSLEVVRLVDAVIVTKSNSGELVQVKVSDPTQEFSQLGAIAGARVGVGTAETESSEAGGSSDAQAHGFLGDDRTWSVTEAIPPGKMAVVALLEHRWANPDTGRGARSRSRHAGRCLGASG